MTTDRAVQISKIRGVSDDLPGTSLVTDIEYDVFLSHSHADSEWVEELAKRLHDTYAFRVWLDRWLLVPGRSWQQAMAKGLDRAGCCAVCIGSETPTGWFRQELERALDIQARSELFGVIPILLPAASLDYVPDFLSLRTWADFRNGKDHGYAFHVLTQGIRGEPIGRWPPKTVPNEQPGLSVHEERIVKLQRLRALGVPEQVVIEIAKKIVIQALGMED